VLLDGTEGVAIANCTFTRLDGNAIFLSGYNRNASIAQNTFEWLGQSAIAAWGLTNDWDGTGGEQPRFTSVIGNLAYSIGLIQKQSSFYFQVGCSDCSLRLLCCERKFGCCRLNASTLLRFGSQAASCQNTLSGNIIFNIPRAGMARAI
jgi:hypothetical protein